MERGEQEAGAGARHAEGREMTLSLVDAGPRLRIGYVLKRFPRLSETFILNELLELRRQGALVEVFSLLKPPEETRHELLAMLDAEVVYLPGAKAIKGCAVATGAAGGPTRKVALNQLLAERPPMGELLSGKGPDEAAHLCLQAAALAMLASARGLAHLHAHFASNATTAALLASRWSGIPFSFTAHARDIYHTYVDAATDAAVRRRKIAESRFVVTVSDYNRRHLIELAGPETARKIRRLYNGVDLSRFAFEQRIGSGETPVSLGVGRLIDKKGFTHLIEAWRLLHKRGVPVRGVIIGDGPERDALQKQIGSAGLEGLVELAGARSQEAVLAAMRRASAIVSPCVVSACGDRDGLPTVLLEALAVGLPAISTTVAGIPEIIEDGQTGLLVPPADPERLADAMLRILAEPELGERLRRAGRMKAERDFDLRRNVAILVDDFVRSANGGEFALEEAEDEDRLRCRG
jgi:colanic acid/amylovoran biosynthesis glycosyltransferase